MNACSNTDNNKAVVSPKTESAIKDNRDCNQIHDSMLVRFADAFTPISISLDKSILQELKSFIFSIDTVCLRKQNKYEYFVSVIVAKQALHHLQCCNQGYDLYQMREGAAAIIINEFDRFSGYKSKKLEMLNSGVIVDYINSNSTLSSDTTLANLVKLIKAQQSREDI